MARPVPDLLRSALQLGRAVGRRWIEVGAVERGVAIGAQAFTALLPITMLYAVFASTSDGAGFADAMIRRFELTGTSADAVRQAFQPATALAGQYSNTSVFGMALLIISALSFTRTMQRLYEHAFELPPLGLRGTPWGLAWLAFLLLPLTLRPLFGSGLDGVAQLVVSLSLNALVWIVSPVLLSGRRLAFRTVLPAGLLSAVALTAVSITSVVWLPHSVAVSAAEFGVIGVAFALVSWLVGAGLAISTTTVVAAFLTTRWRARGDVGGAQAEVAG